ncbi:MAG TPA: antitoxin Xre/MbcA/ParS toxin-binding domain-containing protein [Skermanella sp.]|jgi:putative toxin-antitoxin system antitoxin component (TIGR02293 family)|nr:antitoxin Xre/MbcA/ParS toxin-binding domain-containing protein [Skermanella sp.]
MASAAQVVALLGGEKVVGKPVTCDLDIARLIRDGLPVDVIDRLIGDRTVTPDEVRRIIMAPKAIVVRRRKGGLTPEQSERVIRAVRIIAEALETFGSRDKALTWMRRACAVLGGKAPIDLLDTEEGAGLVESLLGRIAHGLAA